MEIRPVISIFFRIDLQKVGVILKRTKEDNLKRTKEDKLRGVKNIVYTPIVLTPNHYTSEKWR